VDRRRARRHVGALPLAEVTVPIGTREIVFRHPLFGERRQVVEVGAGAAADVTVSFGAAPPAEAITTAPEPAAPAPSGGAPAQPPRLAPLSAPRAPRSDSVK
jgi:hypothetical protein